MTFNIDTPLQNKKTCFKIFFKGLDSCIQLQELSLTNNCIAHLEGLSKLSCIQKLDLSHNCLTSIDTGVLANMLSLASLSLESNRLTSLAGLQKCNALTELYIGNNTISNIREVFLLKVHFIFILLY